MALRHVIGGIAIAAAVAGGVYLYKDSKGEVVYEGTIKGDRVEYTQNVGLPFFKKNILRAQRKDKGAFYEFTDSKDLATLDWKSDKDAPSAHLETVVANFPTRQYIFEPAPIVSDSIDASKGEKVFVASDAYYNSVLGAIRDEKRADYIESVKTVVEGLPKVEDKK